MAFINPNPQIPNVPLTPELQEQLSPVTGVPVVMFPVRLETRFFSQPDNSAELRVRVYPDKVHIDTHEPELTDDEVLWGKHFWEQTWRAGNDEERKQLAWRQLADRFDAQRAAWIVRALKPLNPDDQPSGGLSDDQPLPKAINFPNTGTKADAWTRAPGTNVLPDRWHAFTYANGTLVVHKSGNAIPDRVATGPDPAKPLPAQSDTDFAIDDGMKWMVDFDEAEKVGMGIRIALAPDQPKAFDILLVLGTKAGADASEETRQLAALLDAHHYTDGLSFLLNGTPSNNTADAPSGFNSIDPGQEQSYWAEGGSSSFKSGDGSNADALTAALGLGPDDPTLAHLTNSNAQEQLNARHMNRALWPATMGYFLLQMMGVKNESATPLSVDDLRWAREHFIEYVRAAGPLPAVRVGRQPYGLLPATSLNSWKPGAGDEQETVRDVALRDLLVKLRELWRRNLVQVPRLGRGDNPDQDFADVLSTEALSSNYAARHLMGQAYLQQLWAAFTPDSSNPWWGAQQELTLAAVRGLGFDWNPNLCRATYSGWYKKISGPTTQLEIANETAPLDPNYIQLLLSAPDVDTIRQENFGDPKPRGLLYLILRHALLLEYWTAAANLTLRDVPMGLGWSLNREQEIQKIPGIFVPQFQNVWELLGAPLAGVTDQPLGAFLHGLKSTPDPNMAPHVATLLEFRDSLAYLQNLSADKLQRAFAGTLDLCSHRLDAWITSIATRRLAEIRKKEPGGNILGGYGWVMNLKPDPAPAIDTTPPGEQGIFLRPANNPGFTQTPSLGQAATVAVLRSGHLTHSDRATKDLLAIDLSSARGRLAAWLLDGVRQGQPLGALLGYRFERRLQEAGLAQFISPFREVAPLVARKLEQSAQPVESIAANNVVDGLLLQTRWKAQPTLSGLFSNLTPQPNPDQSQAATLQAELNLLDEAVDAVSDALLAESVHHAVQGNPTRTASTLNAIASGEVAPPQLDVLTTPRTGTALTYRLVTLFSGPPSLPAAWNPPSSSVRATAEPVLNGWAAQLLGDPGKVRCQVEQLDPAGDLVLQTKELRLNELSLAPLDFIYAAQGSRDAQPSELEWRILYTLRRKPDGFAPDAILRINPRRGSDWTTEDLSYGEFSELLQSARRLITGVRGIDGSELNIPERNQGAAIDADELSTRADAAAASLRALLEELQALLAKPTDSESLREAILRASQFGTAAPVPLSPAGDAPSDRDLLSRQLASIAAEFAQRVAKLKGLEDGATAATDPNRVKLERLRTILGSSFVILPRFSAANTSELQQALAASETIQDGDPLQAVTWFQRAARVRPGVERLNTSLAYAESLQTGERLNLRIAQLPFTDNDRWVALPLQPNRPLSVARFSLVIQAAGNLDLTQPLAGALIDEWVELVPNSTETTGVVFQYDQPGTAPPQCILLAVPPDLDSPWSLWSLQQVLLETLDLAMIRAVDPDTLDEVGHYLPGLYFAINDEGETVSTDLTRA